MSFTIAPIVEGHGDVDALPILLRAIRPDLTIARPVRFPKSKLVVGENLRRAAAIAGSNIGADGGAVLVVFDADEGCAATDGPQVLNELKAAVGMHGAFVAIAVREYEAWIVGGCAEFGENDPESRGSLKTLIKSRSGQYKETVDQPRWTARIDVARLRELSPSFARLDAFIRSLPD